MVRTPAAASDGRDRTPPRGFDLHLHSSASDGTLPPAALAAEVRQAGLAGFALTDHDTVAGLAEASRAARSLDLRFLAGIEISAKQAEREVHVLGYGIDPDDETLLRRLQRVRRQREERAALIVERLRGLRVPVTLDEVRAEAGDGVPGRPHVAAVLLRRGLVRDEAEVWRHWLGRDGVAFVPRQRPDVAEAAGWIREAGGVAVLAHPALDLPPPRIASILERGFGGVEVDHPEQDDGMRKRLRSLARERGLVCTGGSDSHGERGHRTPVGAERVGEDVVEALERAARASAERVPPGDP